MRLQFSEFDPEVQIDSNGDSFSEWEDVSPDENGVYAISFWHGATLITCYLRMANDEG